MKVNVSINREFSVEIPDVEHVFPVGSDEWIDEMFEWLENHREVLSYYVKEDLSISTDDVFSVEQYE